MIPKIIHFIWIRVDNKKKLEFQNYAPGTIPEHLLFGIKSAVVNTNCKIVLHTNDADIKELKGVEIRYKDFNIDIFGKFNPEKHYVAHIADYYRLEILYNEGGIYSDLDNVWLRNPYEFWDNRVVISWDNPTYKVLRNGIIMAEPKQEAIKQYKDWIIENFPFKKYWFPANPYKIWKDRPEVLMVPQFYFKRTKFIHANCKINTGSVSLKQVEKSICIHVGYTREGSIELFQNGELYPIIKKDIDRYFSNE